MSAQWRLWTMLEADERIEIWYAVGHEIMEQLAPLDEWAWRRGKGPSGWDCIHYTKMEQR